MTDETATLLDLEEPTAKTLPLPAEGRLFDLKTPEQRNQQRGLYAGVGLKAYTEHTRAGDEDLETAISDLIGDLRHLCDALEIDFDAQYERGSDAYIAETSGDG